MRSEIITVGLLAFLVGLTIQPYAQIAIEFWLSRPRRIKPRDLFDHCGPECTIR